MEARAFSIIFQSGVFACTVLHNCMFFVTEFIGTCPAVSYNELSAMNR